MSRCNNHLLDTIIITQKICIQPVKVTCYKYYCVIVGTGHGIQLDPSHVISRTNVRPSASAVAASRLRAFQRAKDESHTLCPLKGGSETLLRRFTNKTDILSINLRYKVSLRQNF